MENNRFKFWAITSNPIHIDGGVTFLIFIKHNNGLIEPIPFDNPVKRQVYIDKEMKLNPELELPVILSV